MYCRGMETPKPYNEVIVFIILMIVGFTLLTLATVIDNGGVEKYCKENPSHCEPANYPGKVVQK